MSEEKMEVARRWLEAWNRWVFDDMASFYAPGAEIVSPASRLVGDVYTGQAGLRLYIEHFLEAFERPAFELEEILDAGGPDVVVVYRTRARGRQSGVEVVDRTAEVLTVAGGLIQRQVISVDRSAALQAVGLSPSRRPSRAGHVRRTRRW
jgi:ketosteroid isomerase-like protein